MTDVLSAPPVPELRTVVVRLADGFDGVLRVALLLRGRRYQVHALTCDVGEGSGVAEVRATVRLSGPQAALLLDRLRRLAGVLDADAHPAPTAHGLSRAIRGAGRPRGGNVPDEPDPAGFLASSS